MPLRMAKFFLLGFLIWNMYQQTLSTQSEKNLYSFSQRIKFTYSNQFVPATQAWLHTFITDIPLLFVTKSHRDSLVYPRMKHIQSSWLNTCLISHDQALHGPIDNETVTKETDIETYCVKYEAYLKKLIAVFKENHQLID